MKPFQSSDTFCDLCAERASERHQTDCVCVECNGGEPGDAWN
jgi:hypothetical protein